MSELAALIEPHIPSLRRYAWALAREEAAVDDLVQDALERAIARWHLRRRDGDVRAWLFAIMHNLFVSQYRTRRRRPTVVPIGDWDQPVESGAEGRLSMRDILAALAELPSEQRAVVLLVGVEDFSYEQAARILDVPIGTIMSRLSRGRDKLRRAMEGEKPGMLRRVK